MKNKATRRGRGGGGGGWIDSYFRYIRAVKNWIGSDVVEFVFQFSIKSGEARIRGRFVSKNTRASIFSTVTRYFSKTLRIQRAKRGKITMRTGRVSFPEFVNSALRADRVRWNLVVSWMSFVGWRELFLSYLFILRFVEIREEYELCDFL